MFFQLNNQYKIIAGCSQFNPNTFISWRTGEILGIPDFLPADSPFDCQDMCIRNSNCDAWNFHKKFGCNLKAQNNGKKKYLGWTSGTRDACRQGKVMNALDNILENTTLKVAKPKEILLVSSLLNIKERFTKGAPKKIPRVLCIGVQQEWTRTRM